MSNIIEERYLISKHINTSYTELDEITPLERRAILRFIHRDAEAQAAAYENAKMTRNNS